MQKNRTKPILIVIAVLLIGAATTWLGRGYLRTALFRAQQGDIPPEISRQVLNQKKQLPPTNTTKNTNIPAKNTNTNQPPTQPPKTQPTSINIKIPMVFQAPTGNWDAVHEETCEEAAVLMLVGYATDIASYSREEMETQLQNIIAYENKTFGYFEDTDAAETAKILTDYFGLKNIKILPVTSIDDVKKQIALGRPVLLPAAGKLLKNPNFKNGGPPYHMIVAKGYTGTKIITNDPGTRLGENYMYDQDVLFTALHDWNGGDVLNGKKVMIVWEE